MKANGIARILSKGKSIEYSKWNKDIYYSNDCFKQDFVSYGNSLLACVQSHQSSADNEPVLIYENPETQFNIIGVQNTDYWELVMTAGKDFVYVPEYDDTTGILSWKLSNTFESVTPVTIKLLGPWEHGTGEDSAILGVQNSAEGNFSIAGGYQTKTSNDHEVSFGKFNKTSENTAFSIGSGEDNEYRSNIFEITKDGKQYIVGIGGYDGTNSETAVDVAAAMKSLASSNIPITYDELKALRDANELKAGNSYQITDYVTTCVYDNAFSAEHPFDLIVTVLNSNTLSERAKAVIHEGDEYFANSNLAAWDIWYCLDNDRNKYHWAVTDDQMYTLKVSAFGTTTPVTGGDKLVNYPYYVWRFKGDSNITVYSQVKNPDENTTVYSWDGYEKEFVEFPSAHFVIERNDTSSGKGVIYRMIDEFGNDFPYDFKNIVYKMPKEHVKLEIEYDWDVSITHTDTLIYDPNNNVVVYDAETEKEIRYYAWRIWHGSYASGICYTLTSYENVNKNTILYQYVPPKVDETINIVNSIGDEQNNGEFVPLDNVRILNAHTSLMQYTFGSEEGSLELLEDETLNNFAYYNICKYYSQDLPNIWIYYGSYNTFDYVRNIDRSQINYGYAISDTLFTDDSTGHILESTVMCSDAVKDFCKEVLEPSLYYGYGSGSGGVGSSIPTCSFRTPTYGLGSKTCPIGVSILYADKFLSIEDWRSINYPQAKVVVSDGEHKFSIFGVSYGQWGNYVDARNLISDVNEALNDWDGKLNTQWIIDAGTDSSMFREAIAYNAYIPSLGELNLIYNYKDTISEVMGIPEYAVWSSTLKSESEAWYINLSYGNISSMYTRGPNFDIILLQPID